MVVLARRGERRRLEEGRRLGKSNAKRVLYNLDAVVASLRRAANGTHDVKVVSLDASVPWSLQVALWRRAKAVVGLHGGELAGAVFLGPGQALVEITPPEHSCGHPSMFAHAAIAAGAAYRGVLCQQCSMARGGFVSAGLVARAVAGVLVM